MKKIKINIWSVIISIASVILLVGLDQLTKFIASHNETLLNGEKIIFIKHLLSFYLTYNKGAAWSILTGKKVLLVSISVVASIGCLALITLTSDFKKNWLYSLSIVLITAGAIGNLIDRAFFEEGVIDFLNFEFMDFPIFNVADSMLTVGAVLLAVYFVFFSSKKEEKKEEKIEEDETTNEIVEEEKDGCDQTNSQ